MSKCFPDDSHERAVGGIVAGIDEAGIGPWAGPVVAAAVVFEPGRIPTGIHDSKLLKASERERLFNEILAVAHTGIGNASVEEIDRLNILAASHLAMRRALELLGVSPQLALIDGKRLPALPCAARAIIGGDRLCVSIAAASILAKVTRDRIMAELASLHPAYGWEKNSGYGTKQHQGALALHGVTAHHRRSYRPVRAFLVQAAA